MKVNVLSDSQVDSGISPVLIALSRLGYREFFENRNYGSGLLGIVVGFICQDARLNLKRRIRFVKAEKTLYMDIMLDLEEMKKNSDADRKKIIINSLISEIPNVLSKYKIEDFNHSLFYSELVSWASSTGWR